MSKFPILSVIMSVLNGEKFLNESIDSILNQSFTNFEFIIIDNASKDQSRNIISKYRDNRIHYIKNQKNIGLTDSLNVGLNNASGKYVARMDADDIAYPKRFELQVKFLEENDDYVLVGTCFESMFPNGTKTKNVMPATDELIRLLLPYRNCFAHPTVMFKNDFVSPLRYDPKYKLFQDYPMWWELAKKGLVANLSYIGLRYRIHPNQESTSSHFDLLNNELINFRKKMFNNLGIKINDYQIRQFVRLFDFNYIEPANKAGSVRRTCKIANNVVAQMCIKYNLQKKLGKKIASKEINNRIRTAIYKSRFNDLYKLRIPFSPVNCIHIINSIKSRLVSCLRQTYGK